MLDIFTVAFFGHRYIENPNAVELLLEKHIWDLLASHIYVDFLVGRNGEFDQCAASSVRRVRRDYGGNNSSLVLVLPYDSAEYENNRASFEEYYSNIELCQNASLAHPKSAIQIRNREMVDRADLIICYVKRKEGGAWKTVQYAKKQGKTVINLAENK